VRHIVALLVPLFHLFDQLQGEPLGILPRGEVLGAGYLVAKVGGLPVVASEKLGMDLPFQFIMNRLR